MSPQYGLAGRVAAAFVHSKLTPLIIIASLLLGVYAGVALPREEEPQIIVPMVDVFVDLPGASPSEVEQRVTRPIEKLLWEVPGLEYLYSTSSPGQALIIARFFVGEDDDRALVRLNQKLAAAAERLPAEASAPVVRARSIDDVPVMSLTIWGAGYDDGQLRQIGAQLQESLKEIPDISEVTVIGGRPRQITVELDPAALAARGLNPLSVQQALTGANARMAAADVVQGNRATRIEAGGWPESAGDLRGLTVGDAGGSPVRLADVTELATRSTEEIAERLNRDDVQHRAGGGPGPAVKDIARRGRFYLGYVTHRRGLEERPGRHPALIDEETWRDGVTGNAPAGARPHPPLHSAPDVLPGRTAPLWRLWEAPPRSGRHGPWQGVALLPLPRPAASVVATTSRLSSVERIERAILPADIIERAREELRRRLALPRDDTKRRRRLEQRRERLSQLFAWGDLTEAAVPAAKGGGGPGPGDAA